MRIVCGNSGATSSIPTFTSWGVRRKRQRMQEIENLFEKLMTENFPNLVKEIDIQVPEAQRVPNKRNPKRPTTRHNIIKIPKVKDKGNLKSSKRKAVSYLVTCKGAPIRLSADFSTETLQARRD
ncbi:hypothetical protein HJG60_009367 [Phyllostomus discolor]|uniref:L1 transposable element RRM domain-containing protein n=1 Tax=Phyllostomus discolor TaxID=89673 RepID=A0A833YIZ2_9CHIR|nr:hypothetical protein HJG60_009367 [Phyllostomus discolor]